MRGYILRRAGTWRTINKNTISLYGEIGAKVIK